VPCRVPSHGATSIGSFNASINADVGLKCHLDIDPTSLRQNGFSHYARTVAVTQTIAITRGFEVDAGDTTFYLACRRVFGSAGITDDIRSQNANTTAIYSPNRV
jgi:hypothetical protein